MRNILVIYLISSGCVFFLTTGIAMIRFTDLYSRLHGGAKSLAGGALSFLLAYMLQTDDVTVILKILLMTVFLLITNPLATHALARSAYRHKLHIASINHDEYQMGNEG